MRRVVKLGLVVLMMALLATAGGVFYLHKNYTASGPLLEDRTVVIEPGSGLNTIAATLKQAGVIDHIWPLLVQVRLREKGRGLQAGEYDFPAGISLKAVIETLEIGKTVVRRLTIPEGLTSREILSLIVDTDGLQGELDKVPAEGTLLPETYHFSWGEQRSELIARMQADMTAVLVELWAKRDQSIPLNSPEEALVLASIVEKETGVASERPVIAQVFFNRINRKMRLQSDPTVVYALTEGKWPLGRALSRADWKVQHPYNTYWIKGLPPGPIANPGRAALEAVMNPEDNDYLYFVADGTGGHAFAKTLKEHNRNVARWRKKRAPGN